MGVHLGVSGDDLESLLNLVSSSTASYIKKVGRASTMQLDDVHRGHRQTGTVHHAPNVTIQGDIVEVVVGGLNLPLVLLRPVSLVKDSLLSELSIIIELQLGHHAMSAMYFKTIFHMTALCGIQADKVAS